MLSSLAESNTDMNLVLLNLTKLFFFSPREGTKLEILSKIDK